MKILFTKKIDESMISSTLGSHFSYDFVEVIRTEMIKFPTFSLKNKSLIFTSLNGVKAFFDNGFSVEENLVYCVGKNSAQFLEKKGFAVEKICKNASDLTEFIIENKKTESFIHFAGNISLDTFQHEFSRENIDYQKVIIYNTELLFPEIKGKYDAVVFFSPSGVRSFAKLNSLEDVKLFSIGETTENELKKFTQNSIISSKESALHDLLNLIKENAEISG